MGPGAFSKVYSVLQCTNSCPKAETPAFAGVTRWWIRVGGEAWLVRQGAQTRRSPRGQVEQTGRFNRARNCRAHPAVDMSLSVQVQRPQQLGRCGFPLSFSYTGTLRVVTHRRHCSHFTPRPGAGAPRTRKRIQSRNFGCKYHNAASTGMKAIRTITQQALSALAAETLHGSDWLSRV
jgi:hypothetical protein